MQIYTNDNKIRQILNRSDIEELIRFFKELKEPIILRDIRKNFPNQKNLDKNLEFLIANKLIKRQERRYQFCLDVIDSYLSDDSVRKFIEKYNNLYSAEELLVWVGEELWSDETRELIGINFSIPTKYCIENASFRLVTLNRPGKLCETLPNYFGNIDYPRKFSQLSKLIGDVHPEFFVNQLETILERVEAGKNPRRDTIFLQSLLVTNTIASTPEWKMVVPVFERIPAIDFPVHIEQEKRFLFARQLTEKLLNERESFTYLIKKRS